MKVDMEIPNFDQNYYMWDAKQNYWYPHQTGGTEPICSLGRMAQML